MAIALAVNDLVSVKAWSQLGAQAAVNTYNFQVATVVGGGVTDQDFANDIESTFGGLYTSLMSTAGEWHGIQVYFLRRSGALPRPVKSTTSSGPGLQPEVPAPKVSTPILRYQAFSRGAKGRGRVFLPFVSSVFLNATGQPTAALGTLVNSFASVLLTPWTTTVGANTATMVWSLVGRLPGPTVLYTTEQIITAELSPLVGSMHKRGDYGQTNDAPI